MLETTSLADKLTCTRLLQLRQLLADFCRPLLSGRGPVDYDSGSYSIRIVADDLSIPQV